MKNVMILLLITTAAYTVTMLASCGKAADNKVVVADTTNVKYSTDVVPILSSRCYRCHSSSGVILLNTYQGLLTWANNGYLVGTVSHAPGFVPMPYGEVKMSDNEVNLIVAWVHQGAKNN